MELRHDSVRSIAVASVIKRALQAGCLAFALLSVNPIQPAWADETVLADPILRTRKATIEFFLAYVYSNTDNIQANLSYLDYTRLKKEEEKKKKEAAAKAAGGTDERW